MNAKNLRGWLLQQPRPVLLRVTTDGESQEVKPQRSYRRTADSLDALNPDLIEALDTDGKILRACNLREPEATRSDAKVPSELAGDPEAAMLTHFANLIARAYEHSTEVAFSRMVEVFERMNDRADGIESRLERTESDYRKAMRRQIDEQLDRAEEAAATAGESEPSAAEQMAQAFLGGMGGMGGMMPGTSAKPPAKTNGKGKSS